MSSRQGKYSDLLQTVFSVSLLDKQLRTKKSYRCHTNVCFLTLHIKQVAWNKSETFFSVVLGLKPKVLYI